MAVTGYIIKQRYAFLEESGLQKRKSNSFLEPMPYDSKVGREYLEKLQLGLPEVVYYCDKETGQLCAKETTLLA